MKCSLPLCISCHLAPGVTDRGDGELECRQCAAVTDLVTEAAREHLAKLKVTAGTLENWT